MKKSIVIKPYNYDVEGEILSALFYNTGYETEEGWTEIPAASYQLVASALELIKWETHGETYQILKEAIGIVKHLRDIQKLREWNRE